MTVLINHRLCNGCPDHDEGRCEEICPGDLFYRHEGQARLREPSDCWDCFSCVKACPRAALSIELPFQISEARLRLTARIKENHIVWKLRDHADKALLSYTIKNRQEVVRAKDDV
ncbi:MAG: adenylylsulfate reductase [Deltaproteobacteria bacterium]|nr:adenylylsulfate reductase [Deltaproteobacteria bacterium]